MNEYYSVFVIRKFFMNEYYLVFGIRKFFMNEYIRYSVKFTIRCNTHYRFIFYNDFTTTLSSKENPTLPGVGMSAWSKKIPSKNFDYKNFVKNFLKKIFLVEKMLGKKKWLKIMLLKKILWPQNFGKFFWGPDRFQVRNEQHVFWKCFKVVFKVFQKCFENVSKVIWKCFESFSRVFQECFKNVSRVFQFLMCFESF